MRFYRFLILRLLLIAAARNAMNESIDREGIRIELPGKERGDDLTGDFKVTVTEMLWPSTFT